VPAFLTRRGFIAGLIAIALSGRRPPRKRRNVITATFPATVVLEATFHAPTPTT
jgi:hypothetical protein